MRVIHVPSTVGGNPQGMSQALRRNHVDSETWTIQQNYFGYPADKVIAPRHVNIFFVELLKIFALRYIFKCDIVFFNYGAGLYQPYPYIHKYNNNLLKNIAIDFYCWYVGKMAFVELYLLKLFGVKIYVQYQGDDARQGDYSVSNYLINFAKFLPESYYNRKSDDLKRKRIKLMDGVVEKIYALNPDLMNVLPLRAEFLPYSHIDLKDWVPVCNKMEGRPLRVGHAPSNRLVKGTDFIVNAIDKLKQEGYSIDFVLVEGLENKAAKEIYIGLDIVIDQLLAGWYGGLAVEVMALGKPVIAYIRDDDLRHIPEQMKNDLPIINASTSTIYDVLKSVLLMPKMELYEIARKSRAYVERWHDSDRIAARIKRDMEITLGRAD